jgi:phage tail sheath protein FI
MTISQLGSVNTAALSVPNALIQIVPPTTNYINGVPTGILGIVGGASWGPVNSPVIVGSYDQAVREFGPINNRKFDLLTAVLIAAQQGANNFRLVRATSGNDTAATIVVQTTCITFTALYTGAFGNSLQVTVGPGSAKHQASRVVVSLPGHTPEVFDNIAGSGNARWLAIADAINNGQSDQRGPSKLIVATAGVGTTAPADATYTLAGGTDGNNTLTANSLLGSDATPRTGMYALRSTGADIVMLADCDDSTAWAAQVAYGLSEGSYMIMVGPSGDTIANAVTTVTTAGIDSYAAKLLHGDWCYFRDQRNNKTRLVSPQAFVAGLLANLSPEQSSLNKKVQGLVGTQKSSANQVYSDAELQVLGLNGIDLITIPAPGGAYFAPRFGRNSSTDPMVHGDSYTRLTNFIARSLNVTMGRFIGKLQTAAVRREAQGTLSAFLQDLADQGLIGNADGTTPFSVQINDANNPPSRVALGYMQADVKVQYLGVVEYFIVNVEGGTSVTVTRLPAAA